MVSPTAFLRGTLRWRVSRIRRAGLAAAVFLGLTASTGAQDWPAGAKPITLVVGSVAGGGTDVITRILAERLQKKINREVNLVVVVLEVQRRFQALGEVAVGGSARADYEPFGKIVREFGIKTE